MFDRINASKPVIYIFIIALAVRIAAALFIQYGLSGEMRRIIEPPDARCDDRALMILDSWRNGTRIEKLPNDEYHSYAAFIYGVFGYSPVGAEIVNSLIGALIVFFIYGIAKYLFDERVAVFSSFLYAFFPSLIFWSSLNLRDIPALFTVVASIWLILKLQKPFRPLHISFLVIVPFLLLVLNQLRHYIFIFFVYATIIHFIVNIRRSSFVKNSVYAVYFFLVLCIFAQSPYENLEAGMLSSIPAYARSLFTGAERPSLDLYKDFEHLNECRKDLSTGRLVIAKDVDISTPGKALRYLPKGMAYFLFAPFPWTAEGLQQKVAIPGTILWYVLFIFALYGLYVYRMKWRAAFVILFFVAVTLVGYSLVEGNFGTAFRHRAVILPFVFMVASAGITRVFRTPSPLLSQMR